MRVLLVSEYFPPHWTGLSKSFYYLARNVKSQGNKVTVLTTQFESNQKRLDRVRGIDVVRVPFQFMISRTHYSFSIIFEFARMVPGYDAVIINSPNSNILFYSVIAKLYRKKLYVYHQADILLPRHTGNIALHFLIEQLFEVMTIPSMFLADRVSSFTKDYAEFSRVMKYFTGKFQPYIPDVRLSKKAPSAKLRKKLDSLKKKHRLIGISGRFVEEKGFDVLFKALPHILEKFPDAHLVFAGKKILDYEPFYEKHKKLFDSQKMNITYLGFLDEGDLSYFYESLDVFVLSSRIECFALTQIEAWEKHVPIIVTDVPGARQLVKRSGFGEIVNREDPKSLADGIIKVLKNPKKYQKHHSKAKKYLESAQDFILIS